jgi:putative protein-disulfide isomerase
MAHPPVIQRLAKQNHLTLTLAPTGLFSGHNSRELNAEFAQYAWTNDLRIAHMTGQSFTQQYRTQVLGKENGRLDSAAATLALTAVSLSEPTSKRSLDAMKWNRGFHAKPLARAVQASFINLACS